MKFTFAPESRPLDGYTIKRAIYRGGFGEVYYALTDAGREVALKLLQNNTDIELRGVQQCLNLSHPNLVTIFDVKKDRDGDHWIVMEYVAGETLDAAIHRHPGGMPMEEVRNWLRGMTEGVTFLHEQGIVHRDLKPGNVFSERGIVEIGDVGLSKFITPSRRSAHTQSVGTVYYMAPEVAKGRYGREVDVYAIGVMLYEMITGRVPFDGESTGEILMKHLSEKPDLEKLPPRIRPVIDTALQKDPAKRFASVRDLQQAFEAAVLGKSVSGSENVRAVVEDVAHDHDPRHAPVQHVSEWEQTLVDKVDKDDRAQSIWWPTRRAFWIILAAGLLFLILNDGRGERAVACAFFGTYSTYILYTLLRRVASWRGRSGPILRFFDRDSDAVGRRKGQRGWWLPLVACWVLSVMVLGRADFDDFIEAGIPLSLVMFAAAAALHGAVHWFVRGNPRETNVTHHPAPPPAPPQSPPAPSPPVRHARRHVPSQMAVQYYRHRKTSPSVVRPISFQTRMSQFATSATLVVPIVALLTGSVALLSPEVFVSAFGAGPAWENMGLFAATAIIASWMLMGHSKWNEGRRLDGGARRLLQTLGGVVVGLITYSLSEWLLITSAPPPVTYGGTIWSQPDHPMFESIGHHALFFEGGLPTLFGFVAFFGLLFGLRRWWRHVDAFRPKRLRVGSILLTVLLAWVVSLVWAFPSVWAMTWAAVISSAVQLASVWTPPEERFATREV